jgi:hypothetical protein
MLWMGVQVVTWAGKTVSSRWVATSLAPLGLTDFIADGSDSYVELAVAKTADLEALSRLRASLCTRMAMSDWGDGVRYRRSVEAAYLQKVAALVFRADGPRRCATAERGSFCRIPHLRKLAAAGFLERDLAALYCADHRDLAPHHPSCGVVGRQTAHRFRS